MARIDEVNIELRQVNDAITSIKTTISDTESQIEATSDQYQNAVNTGATSEAEQLRAKYDSLRARLAHYNTRLGELQASRQTLNAEKYALQTEGEPVAEEAAPANETPSRKPSEVPEDKGVAGTVNVAPAGNMVPYSSSIEPRPNILAKFSSIAYAVSIYALTREQHDVAFNTGIAPVDPNRLLIQSAGAPAGKRNKFFGVDFFIDDLEIRTVMAAGNGGPVTQTELSFNVIEPYGLTLVPRLSKALQDLSIDGSYIDQPYLMVIRFYGYDENGNNYVSDLSATMTDHNAIIEKFITFTITQMTFRISGENVIYQFRGMPSGMIQGLGQATASVPSNIELSAMTVADILGATIVGAADQPVPQTINSRTGSLVSEINRMKRLDAGNAKRADEIAIAIVGGHGLETARLRKHGPLRKDKTPAPQDTSPALNANDKTLQLSADERSYTFPAGMTLLQVIGNIIQTSTYITDQSKVAVSENSGRNNTVVNTDAAAETMWFNVIPRVESIGDHDPVLGRPPQRTTYYITPYKIDFRSTFFNTNQFPGVHKRYAYWFTGQNTEILSYEEVRNTTYFASMAGQDMQPFADGASVNAHANSIQTRKPGVNVHGGLNDNSIQAADAASYLYNPVDVAKSTMTILGDPDWLGQYVSQRTIGDGNPFMTDGSVNTAASEILYEIAFNLPEDYNLTTGVMDVTTGNYYSANGNAAGEPNISYIYQAISVDSYFRGGQFSQKIEGVLKPIPPEVVSRKRAESGGNITNRAFEAENIQQTVARTENRSTTNLVPAATTASSTARSSDVITEDARSPTNNGAQAGSSTPYVPLNMELVDLTTNTVNTNVITVSTTAGPQQVGSLVQLLELLRTNQIDQNAYNSAIRRIA